MCILKYVYEKETETEYFVNSTDLLMRCFFNWK